MIEVVLLCDLLALALNIPHLGHDRPSDPAGFTPVYLGHTVTIIMCFTFLVPKSGACIIACYIYVWPNKGPESIACYILGTQCGARGLLCHCMLHIWCPMWGLLSLCVTVTYMSNNLECTISLEVTNKKLASFGMVCTYGQSILTNFLPNGC